MTFADSSVILFYNQMKIGFTSNSFRQIKTLDKIVEIAVTAGVDCIEWSGDIHVKNTADAKAAKALCDKAGIEICSYGSYYRVGSKNAAEWQSVCETANALGAASIRVWLGNEDSEKTSVEAYANLLEDAKSICSVAEKYGLLVCPECHGNTYNNNTDAFLKIREDIASDCFKTYFQSRYRRMEYDLDRIERTLPYIENVHVSFFDLRREQFPKYNPKYMNTILDRLISLGFNGAVLVEFTYPGFKRGFEWAIKRDIAKLKMMIK